MPISNITLKAAIARFILFVAQSVKDPPAMQESACNAGELEFDSWVRKIPWRKKWQLTPVFFPGKSHGERTLK